MHDEGPVSARLTVGGRDVANAWRRAERGFARKP